ncbi:zinc-finger protein [Ruegeria sp. ANG-S4]|uniref:DUF983 domain-containing protein n=1 Tax=Ruegeria sp. ANG-S4 TaxID=1577904 RepID=UPI00057E43F5|nr:DUF983 domain-containing protein [Ruegeria sp. ANG-S4]KIC43600.1 zinc-finger protein [Ruegeria sp. ANG-S4]
MSELAIDAHDDSEERPIKPAIMNGMRLKCPKCGEGRLLHSYIKVNDECPNCGLDLSHQRADDGPAYLTILIVGHLMGFALHIAWVTWRPEPWVLALSMSVIAIIGALTLLPVMKGLIVGYQWANRMHGF